MTVVWLNGLIVDDPAVAPGPLDPGLLVGDGVFTTLAVYDGVPFALDRHLARIGRSVRDLGLGSIDKDLVHEGVTTALAQAGDTPGSVARMRITVWRAAHELGLAPADSSLSVSVAVAPAHGTPAGTVNAAPATVHTSEFQRNLHSAITGHKSTSYAENAYALRAAQSQGASEAILFNTAGDLSEGAVSNVIVQVGNELLTPALSSGCLPGITRELALECANKAGLPLREAEPNELTRSIVGNPAALLGTLRNVQRVRRWDDHELAESELITELARVFADSMTTEINYL